MAFEDTLGSMRGSIRTSLDELSSPRSSPMSKTNALKNLERHLAMACSASAKDSAAKDAFLALQHTFECNIPCHLLPWITLSTFRLEGLTSRSLSQDERVSEMDELSSQLNVSLSLLQGIALHHESSKEYLGRKYSLEILLDLLFASRYLPTQPDSTSEAAAKPVTAPHITSVILDTLLCILVDSTTSLRTFETASGVQAVVKILKRAGTPREVRMKCLEFLYFYLLDETPSTDSASSLCPAFVSAQPTPPVTAPATPIRPAKPYFHTPLRHPSRYGSSTYYLSSSASLGNLSFSDSAHSSSSSSGSSASSAGSESVRSASGSSTFSFSSTSSNASSSTAASSVENSPSLMKDSKLPPPVFIPPSLIGKKSPIKGHRITTPQNLSKHPMSSPISPPPLQDGGQFKQAQPRSLMMLRREVDYVPQSPKKILVPGVGKPPMVGTSPVGTLITFGAGNEPIRRVHRKSQSASTVGSGATSPALFRKRSEGGKARDAGTPLRTMRMVPTEEENSSEKSRGLDRNDDAVLWRTTEQKKEFLGTMLGNVDALVEGVRKAGVWGLG